MTSCNGCGKILGFKKYKFKRMWRIPGCYCKDCMIKVGRDFDDHGKLALPFYTCDLCRAEFLFLKSEFHGKKQKHFCEVCHEVVASGGMPNKEAGIAPGKIPPSLIMIGCLGVLLMVLGMVFTMMTSPDGKMNLVNILFGAFTTAAGFMLVRRTIKNKRLLVGQQFSPTNPKFFK